MFLSSTEPRKITNMEKQTNKNLALSIKSIKKKLPKVISKQTYLISQTVYCQLPLQIHSSPISITPSFYWLPGWFGQWELSLEKEEEPISNFQLSVDYRESKGIPEKVSTSVFVNYAKAFECVYHNKLWKALKEMEIPDHLTCFLRNLFVGQEATVRTLCGTNDWFKIEKGVQQNCLLSPCLFNLYAEHIMRNARLDEL